VFSAIGGTAALRSLAASHLELRETLEHEVSRQRRIA
jgi:hypothetical protein